MLKKMKNYQILDLAEAFKRITQMNVESTKKFNYAVILNDEKIQSNVKALTEIAKPSEEYMEYEQKRQAIVSKYAEVDENGQIVLVDNKWVRFKEGGEQSATEEVDVLINEYKDTLDQRDKDIKEYNDLLDSEIKINMQMVDIDDVPDEVGKNMGLMKYLMSMID